MQHGQAMLLPGDRTVNPVQVGALEIEDWYAKSSLEFCTQLADGRLGYIATVRDDVPYLLERRQDFSGKSAA